MKYSVKDGAKMVGVAQKTIYCWIKEGKLPERRDISDRLYLTDEDIEFVKSNYLKRR